MANTLTTEHPIEFRPASPHSAVYAQLRLNTKHHYNYVLLKQYLMEQFECQSPERYRLEYAYSRISSPDDKLMKFLPATPITELIVDPQVTFVLTELSRSGQ